VAIHDPVRYPTRDYSIRRRRRVGILWDPTGRLVAFQRREDDNGRLHIVAVEGGSVQEIGELSGAWDPEA